MSLRSAGVSGYLLLTAVEIHNLLPELSPSAFRSMLSRYEKTGFLKRICRGLFKYPADAPEDGLLLYRAAARLRTGEFQYISLESALSDAGVISQVPVNCLTLMTSGRSYTYACGKYGRIEYTHTAQSPASLADLLIWDERAGLWRATVPLAMRDLRRCGRSLDLLEESMA
jgi:predicted transcriptional regulator of viral defense system